MSASLLCYHTRMHIHTVDMHNPCATQATTVLPHPWLRQWVGICEHTYLPISINPHQPRSRTPEGQLPRERHLPPDENFKKTRNVPHLWYPEAVGSTSTVVPRKNTPILGNKCKNVTKFALLSEKY